MIDIFGRGFFNLSGSADLQQSLESRLRRTLDARGSLEYELTWKQCTMPWGLPICQQQASARPISDTGYGGWPTPMTNRLGAGAMDFTTIKRMGILYRSSNQSRLKTIREHYQEVITLYKKGDGWRKIGIAVGKLCLYVLLGQCIVLYTYPAKRKGLHPELSRWLMGFPAEWSEYAPMETQLSHRSPQSLSGLIAEYERMEKQLEVETAQAEKA